MLETNLITNFSLPTHYKFQNLTGRRFHRLFVLRFNGRVGGSVMWLCRCDCGIEKPISTGALTGNRTHSCGCKSREQTKQRSQTHGNCANYTTTGEYQSYLCAKARCNNSNKRGYKNYGGRGIKFLFTSFEEFFAEIGAKPSPKHSLDRKNNDGHYEKGNVKWATKKEQCRNTRVNRWIEYKGERRLWADWVVDFPRITGRLFKKWCVPCAFEQPLRGRCLHRGE